MADPAVRFDVSLLGDDDLHYFNQGTHLTLYDRLGAHPLRADGVEGTYFAVWAPNAERVSVIGEANDWDPERHGLRPRGVSGIWEGFVPGMAAGALYKYQIASRVGGGVADKADPVAFAHETPPGTASRAWTLDWTWGDHEWMRRRRTRQALATPISIYEVHLGSWRRDPAAPDRPLGYREIAPQLAAYVREMGFTHVELLPVMEHPADDAWGYRTSGFFAPSARHGSPQDLMFLIDHLHRAGIGVILDWVPSHFSADPHGLGFFDGTHLYEHQDPREGVHPEWGTLLFNYGRNEVRSFLLSSACFWLERYHADGLRVNAVASMLYRDYARAPGEWVPNHWGGRENLEATAFLRILNEQVYARFPGVQTWAEEASGWPMVSRPTYAGGLGFGFTWDLGWTNDTLEYLQRDPGERRHHHDGLTFRQLYAYSESFLLPLSHDDVADGKGSLLQRMPGDRWQRFANLRLLLGCLFAQPGKKLLFMGGELAQWRGWHADESLDWHLLDDPAHSGLQRWVRDLNAWYRRDPALHELDCASAGFRWIDCADAGGSTLAFLRRGRTSPAVALVAANFTPEPRPGHRVGVPVGGRWKEVLNGDARAYGGSGVGNLGGALAEPVPAHGQPASLVLTLPPLGMVVLRSPETT